MTFLSIDCVPQGRWARPGMAAQETVIVEFIRALRAAGLPTEATTVSDAVRALKLTRPARVDDFFWVLHAVLVKKREDDPLFRGVFEVFWQR